MQPPINVKVTCDDALQKKTFGLANIFVLQPLAYLLLLLSYYFNLISIKIDGSVSSDDWTDEWES